MGQRFWIGGLPSFWGDVCDGSLLGTTIASWLVAGFSVKLAVVRVFTTNVLPPGPPSISRGVRQGCVLGGDVGRIAEPALDSEVAVGVAVDRDRAANWPPVKLSDGADETRVMVTWG